MRRSPRARGAAGGACAGSGDDASVVNVGEVRRAHERAGEGEHACRADASQRYIRLARVTSPRPAAGMLTEDGLRVCSRNWALARGDNPLWRPADAYRFEERLPRHLAVQSEVCGPRIQKNPMALDETAHFVFSVFDVRADGRERRARRRP